MPDNRAQEYAQRKREEFDKVMRLLAERVAEMNAIRGDLPEVVMKGSSLHLDGFILHLEFDQLPWSRADYVLVTKVDPRSSARNSELATTLASIGGSRMTECTSSPLRRM